MHDRPHLGRRASGSSSAATSRTSRATSSSASVNAFTGATGEGKDQLDGETRSFPDIAKHYGESGMRWCAVGDRNYGEGSSREHAAMEPRFRGGVVIFARSFARIHETNAKKQGLVPLTFVDPATYDAIGEDDRINVLDLPPVPGQNVRCQIVKPDGTTIDFEGTHTFSDEQVEWFKAGRALNIVRQKVAAGSTPTPLVRDGSAVPT